VALDIDPRHRETGVREPLHERMVELFQFLTRSPPMDKAIPTKNASMQNPPTICRQAGSQLLGISDTNEMLDKVLPVRHQRENNAEPEQT
jgi:hypothetical protein